MKRPCAGLTAQCDPIPIEDLPLWRVDRDNLTECSHRHGALARAATALERQFEARP